MIKIFNRSTIVSYILGLVTIFCIGFYYISKEPIPCDGNNIGVINIMGEIATLEDVEYISVSSVNVVQQIQDLDINPDIKGIVLDIDSSGGLMEPAEGIMLALQKTKKPTAAIIRDLGASAAYLIASGADRIFASRLSNIGSIGVTADFLDTSERDRRDGVIFYDLSSGINKGAMKENSRLTTAQKEVIMEDVMKLHEVFVEYIANNRNLSVEKVKSMATGRTYVGDDALALGLIDQIGSLPEATEWLKNKIGEEVSFCYLGEE